MLKEIHDPTAEKKVVATFAGVEMGQATLTVTASDATIPLGSSISYDLAELIQMNVMEPVSEYVNELAVAILPEGTNDAAPEELVTTTVCTVSLKLTYSPSPKDQREELYEILNKATQRKAKALEKLKQMAAAAARSQGASAGGAAPSTKKPAMQSGFLNKPKKVVHWSVQWYNKHLGPTSIIRTVLPIAKNYIIFFGAVGFFHFKGQMLALPPPV